MEMEMKMKMRSRKVRILLWADILANCVTRLL